MCPRKPLDWDRPLSIERTLLVGAKGLFDNIIEKAYYSNLVFPQPWHPKKDHPIYLTLRRRPA